MGIGKTESKKLKSFQKLLNQNSQSPQCNQSSRRRGVEEMFMRTTHIWEYWYLKMYLKKLYFIFRSNKIKEQHEAMKLQNEEIMLRTT